jgi:hypothetical protein
MARNDGQKEKTNERQAHYAPGVRKSNPIGQRIFWRKTSRTLLSGVYSIPCLPRFVNRSWLTLSLR